MATLFLVTVAIGFTVLVSVASIDSAIQDFRTGNFRRAADTFAMVFMAVVMVIVLMLGPTA